MSEILKCPFCNKTLQCKATHISEIYVIDLYHCANPDCESTEFLVGCKEFWDILGQHRRTRKALDVAVYALKEISLRYQNELDAPERVWSITATDMCDYADNALDQITELKQKD